MKIRKNDQVLVIAGRDRGKKGRVLSVIALRLRGHRSFEIQRLGKAVPFLKNRFPILFDKIR